MMDSEFVFYSYQSYLPKLFKLYVFPLFWLEVYVVHTPYIRFACDSVIGINILCGYDSFFFWKFSQSPCDNTQ